MDTRVFSASGDRPYASRWYLVPRLYAVSAWLCFVTLYFLSVYNGHVLPFLPYVSDAGAHLPEQIIFSSALNIIGAIGIFLICYKRSHYKQYLQSFLQPNHFILYLLELYVPLLSVGFIILPMSAIMTPINMLGPHLIVSATAFITFIVGLMIETIITYWVVPHVVSARVARFRAMLNAAMVVSALLTAGGFVKGHSEFRGSDITKWKPEDGGFTWHVISAAFEWIMVLCLCVYAYTWSYDCAHFTIKSLQVEFSPCCRGKKSA